MLRKRFGAALCLCLCLGLCCPAYAEEAEPFPEAVPQTEAQAPETPENPGPEAPDNPAGPYALGDPAPGAALLAAPRAGRVSYPAEGGNLYFDPETGTITDCDESVARADIPSEIGGVSVTAIGSVAFFGCSSLTAVTISEGAAVTAIGDSAFQGCSSLKELSLPKGLTRIGGHAFDGCSSLGGALTIPGGVSQIEEGAFENCSSLKTLSISPGVKSIGVSAFYGCTGLSGPLVLPDSLESIGPAAFSGCSGLSGRLLVPGGVESIGAAAFFGCSRLTGIDIPAGTASIRSNVFGGCSRLTEISVSPQNPHYSSKDGVLFNREMTTLLAYPAGRPGVSYAVPDGVKSIGGSAFYGSAGLTGKLVLPDSLESIGGSAFSGCSGLTGKLTIPYGVTHIEDSAFHGCSGFTGELVLPGSVVSVGNGAFRGCSGLTGTLAVPDSAASIGYNAFAGCSGLTEISASGNGRFFSRDGVLFDRNGMALLAYPAGKPDVFYTVPDGTAAIRSSPFEGCGNLQSVSLPASLTDFNGGSAFFGCPRLKKISVDPENRHCSSVDGVLFDAAKTSLLLYPAGRPESLYVIPDGVASVFSYAFSGCGRLRSVAVPSGVTFMYPHAFEGFKLQTVLYAGGEDEWHSIDFSTDIDPKTNAPLLNAKIYFNGERPPAPSLPEVSATAEGSKVRLTATGGELSDGAQIFAFAYSDGYRPAGPVSSGTYDASKGEAILQPPPKPGGRLFFLHPDTLIPLAKPAVLE